MIRRAAPAHHRDTPPRPAVWRRGATAVVRAARTVAWYMDSVVGGQDYQRYVAHMRRVHPGKPIPDERAYWRERHADAERNPGARCC
ncbi:YbdD/YjiX family protein [Nocardia flavorosea]|uniref:YbdD/YjiX family protein n=1 Tax=Nocardia flavorosea TaxID=53429 RepID=UPI00226BD916|nr:YbdD/YjiX family protein [Nocardia flavorosea]